MTGERLDEVALVCRDLSGGFGQLAAGHAFYQLGEMHRLLGNPEAEEDYRRAGELGASTQPGWRCSGSSKAISIEQCSASVAR